MTDKQLGRYQLVGVLGKGAMGIVYEAIDPHLDRRVAIKTMRLSDAASEHVMSFERRFLTEARSAARLRHPGIVSVFDWGREDDVTYLVMEKIKGVNLRKCLGSGVRFSVGGAVAILRQVLSALAHAHEQKVVHRDIKPENILLDAEGLVRLTDFGIAKIQDGADNGTLVSGLVIGTPRYMSPEQVQGKEVDARSDLFSAGVLLYELLAGRPPFSGDNAVALVSAILQDSPPPLDADGVSLSPVWENLVSKALAKRAEDRFQRAEAFLAALNHAAVSDEEALSDVSSDPSGHRLSSWLRPGSEDLLNRLFSDLEHGSDPPNSAEPTQRSVNATANQALDSHSRSNRSSFSAPDSTLMFAVGWKIWVGLVAIVLLASVWMLARQEDGVRKPSKVSTEKEEIITESSPTQPDASKGGALPAKAALTLSNADVTGVRGQPEKSGSPAVVYEPKQVKPRDALLVPSGGNTAKASVPPSRASDAATPGKCSKLLEKASTGEPLSDSEQKEMVTLCR